MTTMKNVKPVISPYLFSLIPIIAVLVTLVVYANADMVQQKIEHTAAVFSFPHINIFQCVIQIFGF